MIILLELFVKIITNYNLCFIELNIKLVTCKEKT